MTNWLIHCLIQSTVLQCLPLTFRYSSSAIILVMKSLHCQPDNILWPMATDCAIWQYTAIMPQIGSLAPCFPLLTGSTSENYPKKECTHLALHHQIKFRFSSQIYINWSDFPFVKKDSILALIPCCSFYAQLLHFRVIEIDCFYENLTLTADCFLLLCSQFSKLLSSISVYVQ